MDKLTLEDIKDEIMVNLGVVLDVERGKLVVKLTWNDVVFCKDIVDLTQLKE